jgi:3,4-dihydroxy-2-butanone 4-phosphate synthase
MARFISLHSLACLTRQGAEELTARLYAATGLRTARIVVNLYQGKMLAEFEAEKREILEEYFRKEGIHFDWLMRVELEATGGVLKPAAT